MSSVNGCEKTQPESGWHYSWGWVLNCVKSRHQARMCSLLSAPDYGCGVTGCARSLPL